MGALRAGPQVRRGPGARVRRRRGRSATRSSRRWEAVLARPRDRSDVPGRASSTGSPSCQLLEAYRERHGCDWDDPRLAALDLQYHDLRPERSLFARLGHGAARRRGPVARGGDRAAPDDPGLLPGPVPRAVAAAVVDRQLGLARVRPGCGSAAARPYDGSAAGHGRARRGRCSTGVREPGGAAGPTELLGRVGDG